LQQGVKMVNAIHHYINGQKVPGNSGRYGDVFNPATGQITGKLDFANKMEVDIAVQSAKTAFPAWAAMPSVRRVRILFKYKELIEKYTDDLAALITSEHGKVISDAKGSISRGLEVVEFACGAPHLLKGWFSENVASGVDSYSVRQPLGVCAGITPFNFPVMIALWMFPLAVACGNTFVLKPSEKDPSAALRLVELFTEAGAPPGVVNVIQGDKEAVDALLVHPDVKAVSFVGSTSVAEHVYQTASHHGKRVQAFGGAKNHCIVMPDADLDHVADAVVGAAYGSAGERCMALSVAVVIGDNVADNLVKKIIPKVKALKIGNGNDAATEMGPLITQQHLAKVKSYVDAGVEEGAELIVDGRTFKLSGYEKGFFMGGCLFDKVTKHMRVYKEEIFGPVLVIVRVPDFDTALQLINEHEYGNGTSIFTRDGDAARTFASQVQAGMVGINIPIPVPAAFHAFGGWKRSIFADLNMHGTESISFYTRLKTITSRWPTGIRAGAEFMMTTHRD
jgi:malonate-semialdehyde dehydrogenase (acetylating)/methylmalonate-semialdehyde dehydrogenase